MCNIDVIGSSWAGEMADGLTHEIVQLSPVEFNQRRRFLPASVTADPGYINFDRTPYWIEPLECFDVRSPVREVAIMKAVQTAYSTILESILLYYAAHIRTAPCMYVNTTIDAARARIKRNYIPMFQQSGLGDIFQSSDAGNSRKRGITKDELQWVGGGYLVPRGAQNPRMAREIAILLLLMDELDDYARVADGDTIQLFKDRTEGFKDVYKAFLGCTPTIEGMSFIKEQYLKGDQRQYNVRCLKCGMPQILRFSGKRDNGSKYGLAWDYKGAKNETLDIETVRYHCKNCDNPHMEHDKVRLITRDNAFWKPTADPVIPEMRSYQVTGMMSRRGKWYSGVMRWLAAVDKNGKIKDPAKLQVFYNNFLAETFTVYTGKVAFSMASAHRRVWYRKDEIKNVEVAKHCDSEILFLTCTVDVHGDNLAVAVWGWAMSGLDFVCWLVSYNRIYDDTDTPEGVSLPESPVWSELRRLIEEGEWISDNGKKYSIVVTFIDANPYSPTVTGFCSEYAGGVYPIMGRETTRNSPKEWRPYTTQLGTLGYHIFVDYYKDRLAPVLRRTWRPDDGNQEAYTFNAPVDTTDDELRELTREVKRHERRPNGQDKWVWHRPGNAPQELWDLMVYAHASVEVLAWLMCKQAQDVPDGQVVVDWSYFWGACKAGAFFEAA
jgi:phage terminase large subunit GpA-like protein